jgi:hypothetical protein
MMPSDRGGNKSTVDKWRQIQKERKDLTPLVLSEPGGRTLFMSLTLKVPRVVELAGIARKFAKVS